MREEMRAARFLREGEHRAEPEACHEADPGPARSRVAQHEVQRDECEARRRVRAGEAGGMAQGIRTIGEEAHVGEAAAEGLEVPGAVDVGDVLQEAREAVRERDGQQEVEQRTSPGRQARDLPAREPGGQRRKADGAHQDAAARMQQVLGPERAAPQPPAARRIEEPVARDHGIQVQAGEQDHRGDIGRERPKGMRAPVGAHARRVCFSDSSVRR